VKWYQFFAFVYSIISFVIGYSCTRGRQIEPPTPHTTEDLAIRTPQKTMSKLICSGTVSRTRRNTFVANPIISRKWGKDRIVKVYLTKREHVIVPWVTHLSRLTVSSLLWSSLTIGKKPLAWCNEKKWWTTQYQWSKVIFSDESQVCIGQKSVYMYGRNAEKDGDRTLW